MSVVKSHRKESDFQIFIEVVKLRKELENLMTRNFACQYVVLANETDSQKAARQDFEQSYLEDEKLVLLRMIRILGAYVNEANSIYPIYIEELASRRILQAKAIGICASIIHELQFIGIAVHSDLNAFINSAKQAEHVITKIRNWRSSDNKRFKNLEIKSGNTRVVSVIRQFLDELLECEQQRECEQ